MHVREYVLRATWTGLGMCGFWVRQEIKICKDKKRRRCTREHIETKKAYRIVDKPVTNCSSTGHKLVVSCDFVPAFGLNKYFVCSCFWGDVQETFHRCLRGYEGRLSPGRIVLSASCSARLCPAAPPRAPIRPARGMFGFLIRQFLS